MIAMRNSSTRNLIETIANELDQADKVLIGAGAGLSAADGFEYGGAWFQEHFGDFAAAYGMTDAYTAGFYPFPDETEKWAYWSRYINHNRYLKEPGSVYQDLLTMVRDKDYFVLTTNVDHCFQRAHFDKQRLFYTQGDYGLWQCATPCHQATYDNHDQVVAMVAQQHNRHIPAELVPRCPRCGGRMTTNLRADDTFVQDPGWYAAAKRYQNFASEAAQSRTLLLELGVGMNTPAIIKYPFWRMTYHNLLAHYATVSLDAVAPKQISERSTVVQADIAQVLRLLAGA